jgi:type I restriction enzyme, R subunit
MTEEHLERETLGWLADTGYSHCHGLEIAPDGPQPERTTYNQVLLVGKLREAINRLNPQRADW